jgi:hypothetical protein
MAVVGPFAIPAELFFSGFDAEHRGNKIDPQKISAQCCREDPGEQKPKI